MSRVNAGTSETWNRLMNDEKGFSAQLRADVSQMWAAEKEHPFVRGIGDGTLPLGQFQYYMKQDYVFLVDFCRVIAHAAAKAESVEDMGWFARLLDETLNKEMSLHIGFCEDFGIAEDELKTTKPSPTTLAYTRHLLGSTLSGGAPEIATAILPCSWGYAEIGKSLEDRGMPEDQPLYCRWIEMYSSPEFAGLAAWLRGFVDRSALGLDSEARDRLTEIFVTSSRYEYMFWDAAYRMEEWPV